MTCNAVVKAMSLSLDCDPSVSKPKPKEPGHDV